MAASWKELLAEESTKEYYQKLRAFVDSEYANRTVYPARQNIFRALELTPLHSVRVVILGQDPYHQPGQAQGLAFSVPDGVKIPPSLQNIFKEIDREYHCGIQKSGNLEFWARQGVLLLNTVLTVREGEPYSHTKHGWERLTDEIIRLICCQPQPVAFMLWGRAAQEKVPIIIQSIQNPGAGNRKIMTAAHPSPLSCYNGFFGCEHFVKCNQFMEECGEMPIQWYTEAKQSSPRKAQEKAEPNHDQYTLFGDPQNKSF